MTEGQLYAYERFWLAVTDERILREAAIKKGYNEGMEKGLEKGLEKGMKNAHIEDARKMKAKNYAVEDISEITGLTAEEIGAL